MNKKKKIIKRIFGIVSTILLLSLLTFESILIIDKATDYSLNFVSFRISAISSNSMASVSETNKDRLKDYKERIYKGDLIVSKVGVTYDEIKINDVIIYFNNETLVCHRVIKKLTQNDKDYLITQGDANDVSDGMILFNQVKGQVIDVIPKLGYLNLFITSPYGILSICLIILIVIISIFINEYLKSKEEKENNKQLVNKKEEEK